MFKEIIIKSSWLHHYQNASIFEEDLNNTLCLTLSVESSLTFVFIPDVYYMKRRRWPKQGVSRGAMKCSFYCRFFSKVFLLSYFPDLFPRLYTNEMVGVHKFCQTGNTGPIFTEPGLALTRLSASFVSTSTINSTASQQHNNTAAFGMDVLHLVSVSSNMSVKTLYIH